MKNVIKLRKDETTDEWIPINSFEELKKVCLNFPQTFQDMSDFMFHTEIQEVIKYYDEKIYPGWCAESLKRFLEKNGS